MLWLQQALAFLRTYPEVVACLLGIVFAMGQTQLLKWYVFPAFYPEMAVAKRRFYTVCHAVAAGFIWCTVLWFLIDPVHNDYLLAPVVSLGCGIMTPLTHIAGFRIIAHRWPWIAKDNSDGNSDKPPKPLP